jgi:hypothetical protein
MEDDERRTRDGAHMTLNLPSCSTVHVCNVNKLTGSTGQEILLDEPVAIDFRFDPLLVKVLVEAVVICRSACSCADGRVAVDPDGSTIPLLFFHFGARLVFIAFLAVPSLPVLFRDDSLEDSFSAALALDGTSAFEFWGQFVGRGRRKRKIKHRKHLAKHEKSQYYTTLTCSRSSVCCRC